MRHFDAHPYRTDDADGVWDFAAGCMRTYLLLAERAERFARDPEIAEAMATAQVSGLAEPTLAGPVTAESLADLRRAAAELDVEALSRRGYGHERLDQLVTELLLGAR